MLLASRASQTATTTLSKTRWHDDPVLFAKEALGITPWGRQEEILRAVATYPRVAIKSGHKVSKSNSVAILALWFARTRPGARVILTSASGRQVREILWRELTACYRRAKHPLGGKLFETPAGGLRFGGGREVLGFTTDAPERFAGISGANLLFLLDEASGIPPSIYEAVEGNRAGGARVALFSNPTQTAGEFFDAFHDKRHLYHCLTVSSEESPNVTEGREVVLGLATPEWIAEKRLEWGGDSPLFAVRVRGEFPTHASNAIIGLGLVEAARRRHDETRAEGLLELGVDPARFGDDESVLVARRGKKVLALEAYQGLDGTELALKVLSLVRRLRKSHEPAVTVKIDPIGVGASPTDALRRFHEEVDVVPLEASASASNAEYVRLRDELWFGVRDWLAAGGALPPDSKLEGELVAPTYTLDPKNRLKVESKDDIKKRLKRSPDRADALALAVYETAGSQLYVPAPRTGYRFAQSRSL